MNVLSDTHARAGARSLAFAPARASRGRVGRPPLALALLLGAASFLCAANRALARDDAGFGARSALLSACRLDGVAREARCGTFDVPENPQRPRGRHIGIRVAVLPATATRMQRDALAFFSGGPGEAAIDSAADTGAELAKLFADRDIVLIDQRGTGRSSALACTLASKQHPEASVKDVFPPAAVARCAQTLSRRADLAQYSFARFADDVEHVRRALGYAQFDVYALSYGTRAAQVYARAYPEAVRTIYLGSAVPIDIAMPLPFARAAQNALETTLDACASDSACHTAFPQLREETRAVFARLAAGDVSVDVPGASARTTLGAGRIAERLRSMLYRPAGAAGVPLALHRAFVGDWRPFVGGIVAAARAGDADLSWGTFFAITCNEDVRHIREADIASAVQDTALGDYRVRQQQAACAAWPKSELPAGYRDAVRSSIPTLLVSGDLDPATPLSFTAHIAPGFTHRAEIVLHGQGHTGWSDCVAHAYQQLVQSASAEGIETNCPATPRPAFQTSVDASPSR